MAQSFHSKQLQTNQQAKGFLIKASIVLCSSFAVGLTGCSTLPKHGVEPVQYAKDIDTSETSLAKIITPLRQQNPKLTGFHVLNDPLEALAARLRLIDKAEKTLDLQYYIWDNDKVGALALHAIIRAADRGVKVRLLIDDNNAKKWKGFYWPFLSIKILKLSFLIPTVSANIVRWIWCLI